LAIGSALPLSLFSPGEGLIPECEGELWIVQGYVKYRAWYSTALH
jgi:hypothetical protein